MPLCQSLPVDAGRSLEADILLLLSLLGDGYSEQTIFKRRLLPRDICEDGNRMGPRPLPPHDKLY